ncbi:MAG: helix-turn-helix domain-containing protein [Anaerolineales bacterium]
MNIADKRKELKLSQEELAQMVGVSQATISRIEKGEYAPSLQMLIKIARALNIDIREAIPEGLMNDVSTHEDMNTFMTICPNPLCDSNDFYREDGKDFVLWKSWQQHGIDQFEEINFCEVCGIDLIKGCPSCGRKLEKKGARFCITCGTNLHNRPTPEEWTEIREILNRRTGT